MRFPLTRRVRLAGLVVVVLGLATGGIAYATIPDGAGVIHGCYTTMLNQGQVRVIDTGKGQVCKPGEQALNWGQTGAPGPPGPAGTSDGGSQVTTSDTTVPTGNSFVVVTGTTINNLPAGNYVYSASVYITPNGGTTVASCFALGTTNSGSSGVGNTTVSSPQWIPVVGKLTLNSAQDARIECNEDSLVHGFLVHGAWIVTRVATLH